jgi:DNA-binding transcriptional ArsR family regulator
MTSHKSMVHDRHRHSRNAASFVRGLAPEHILGPRTGVGGHQPPVPDRIFAALGDATRRDIVLRAVDANEGVAELAGHYPMSFAAVQKHVAVLERAGLVTKERTGRRKVVRTNIEGLRVARGLLDEYEALWRGRIDRMTDLTTRSKETGA